MRHSHLRMARFSAIAFVLAWSLVYVNAAADSMCFAAFPNPAALCLPSKPCARAGGVRLVKNTRWATLLTPRQVCEGERASERASERESEREYTGAYWCVCVYAQIVHACNAVVHSALRRHGDPGSWNRTTTSLRRVVSQHHPRSPAHSSAKSVRHV